MPRARPSMEVTFTARIDKDDTVARRETIPKERLTASAPETTGRSAATSAPKATTRSTRVSGTVRRSAWRTSSVLVRQMS